MTELHAYGYSAAYDSDSRRRTKHLNFNCDSIQVGSAGEKAKNVSKFKFYSNGNSSQCQIVHLEKVQQ
mgnify:CR=1 FL=1